MRIPVLQFSGSKANPGQFLKIEVKGMRRKDINEISEHIENNGNNGNNDANDINGINAINEFSEF